MILWKIRTFEKESGKWYTDTYHNMRDKESAKRYYYELVGNGIPCCIFTVNDSTNNGQIEGYYKVPLRFAKKNSAPATIGFLTYKQESVSLRDCVGID